METRVQNSEQQATALKRTEKPSNNEVCYGYIDRYVCEFAARNKVFDMCKMQSQLRTKME